MDYLLCSYPSKFNLLKDHYRNRINIDNFSKFIQKYNSFTDFIMKLLIKN